MQYNPKAIMAMIASALNPHNPEESREHISFHSDLTELDRIPDRDALLFYMADGRIFQIDVAEVV